MREPVGDDVAITGEPPSCRAVASACRGTGGSCSSGMAGKVGRRRAGVGRRRVETVWLVRRAMLIAYRLPSVEIDVDGGLARRIASGGCRTVPR